MKRDVNHPEAGMHDLRKRAEELLEGRHGPDETELDLDETRRLLHELRVFQIELELQNQELRESRQEVEAALEKYTDLYDFAPVGYFTVDSDGIINEVNLAGASLLGLTRSQVVGRRFERFVANDSRSVLRNFLSKTGSGEGKRNSCEIALAERVGARRYVHLDGVAAAADARALRIAMTDVTDRINAEESAKRNAADLMRSNQDLEQFAYVASHDLQEPLRQITGFIQLLQKRYQPLFDEQARQMMGYVMDGATRMQALIQDLLAFARLAHEAAAPVEVDLASLLQQVLQDLKATLVEARMKIHVGELPRVKGNPTLLSHVLRNLLTNAIKFRKPESPQVTVDSRLQSNEWLIWVQDNGIGFAPEQSQRIFQLFQRLHPTGKYSGTGIGLSICKRAIELHGGRIWAESTPGEGATFYFTLPM